VRRGVRVAGLLAGPPAAPGVPHVAGVRTTDGEEVRADLVVDAGGRRTAAAAWLADLGARPPLTDSQDSGFVYYTRYFTGPERPPRRAPGLAPFGSISVLTLDGDNDTWSVTVYGRSTDRPLKALRDPAAFARVVGACPRQAHWLAGRPITGVLAMAGIQDRYRSFVVDGRPVVTGFAAVGDSWACTNPSAGRGLSVGMAQVQQLREAVAEALDDPVRLALTYHERTERHVAPFYRGQLEADRLRTAEMAAAADGAPPPQPDPTTARWQSGTAYSAELFRAFLEGYFCLATPAELAARPAVQRALERTGTAPPPRLPGPDRAALLELLAG
jgi:2-polyprenyl-6-methoxyphenol hydroxylase-like FAD-dependent oxidoreductase